MPVLRYVSSHYIVKLEHRKMAVREYYVKKKRRKKERCPVGEYGFQYKRDGWLRVMVS